MAREMLHKYEKLKSLGLIPSVTKGLLTGDEKKAVPVTILNPIFSPINQRVLGNEFNLHVTLFSPWSHWEDPKRMHGIVPRA